MNTTSVSLLERLRQPADRAAWDRFVEVYTPLLYAWACRLRLQSTDAADMVQDVLMTVLQKMPEFCYDRGQSFRGWLRIVAVNKWRDACRRRATALGKGDTVPEEVAGGDDAEALWEAEYQRHVASRALELMQAEFEPTTWKACWQVVAEGRSVQEVAAELGLTANAVYVAKYRVVQRLRQELAGLLD